MLKQLVEQLLLSSGVAHFAQQRRKGSSLVLAYHNVVPERASEGDRSLHLAFDQFVAQLDVLEQSAQLVALNDATANLKSGRMRVAITFDDAYRGALELAIPELVRRRIPATIFVAPGLLGAPGTWWDRYISPDAPDSEALRETALTTHRGQASRIDAWMGERNIAPARMPAHYAIADEKLLAHVAAMPGITLGVHTWDHPNLNALSRDEVGAQLGRSIEWLSRFDSSRPWIAYPYGLNSVEVREACRKVGLTHGYRVAGGFLSASDEMLGQARFNVPSGLSISGFRLRLAGLLTDR